MENQDDRKMDAIVKGILTGALASIAIVMIVGYMLTVRAIKDLEEQIDALSEQISECYSILDVQLHEMEAKVDELATEAEKLSTGVDKLKESVSALDASLSASIGRLKIISSNMDDIALANHEGRLLPCNRCGGEVELVSFDSDTVSYILDTEYESDTRYFVYCHSCGKYYGNYGSKDECIEGWNFCAGLDYYGE